MHKHVLFCLSTAFSLLRFHDKLPPIVTCTWKFFGVDKRVFSCNFVHITNKQYCTALRLVYVELVNMNSGFSSLFLVLFMTHPKISEVLKVCTGLFDITFVINSCMRICNEIIFVVPTSHQMWKWNRSKHMQNHGAQYLRDMENFHEWKIAKGKCWHQVYTRIRFNQLGLVLYLNSFFLSITFSCHFSGTQTQIHFSHAHKHPHSHSHSIFNLISESNYGFMHILNVTEDMTQ